jgi:hypothetical protein
MCEDRISSDEKVRRLREELARMHKDKRFENCESMGEITFLNIAIVLNLESEAPARFIK